MKTHDLVVFVPNSEWTNNQGEEKKRSLNIGSVIKKKNGGAFLVLHSWVNLAALAEDGEEGVFVNLFEPKQQRETRQDAQHDDHEPEFNDDIPF